jgi:hypothetical protein
MSERQFYVLALSARKSLPTRVAFNPKLRQTLTNQPTTVGMSAWATVAASTEEARDDGLARAREDWPEAEGWTEHTVAVCEVEYAALEDIMREIAGEPRPPEEEWLDMLM